MTILQSFQPTYGSGQVQSATATSAPFVLDANTTTSGGGNKAAVVTNQGNTYGVYFRIGQATADTAAAFTASVDDYYLPPGSQVCVTKAETDNYIAFFGVGTTPVHVIVGEGF